MNRLPNKVCTYMKRRLSAPSRSEEYLLWRTRSTMDYQEAKFESDALGLGKTNKSQGLSG